MGEDDGEPGWWPGGHTQLLGTDTGDLWDCHSQSREKMSHELENLCEIGFWIRRLTLMEIGVSNVIEVQQRTVKHRVRKHVV